MANTIITIGRQYGSGGKEIGERLAKDLGITFYDKELLKVAAKESGLCEEIFENFDEKPTNSFLYSLVMDPYAISYNNGTFELPLNHKVFLAAFDAIKKIAAKGPCVIVGRCADYALADDSNCISVFIKSSEEARIERIMKRHDVTKDKAADIMRKKDKQRASYYNYYTTKKWGNAASYDYILDSNVLGVDKTIQLIKDIIELKEQQIS